MVPPSSRIVIVDTNCFLRLYQSPVLPLLGQEISGFVLQTLPELVREFRHSERLSKEYPWIMRPPVATELGLAKVILTEAQQLDREQREGELKAFARAVLNTESKKRGLPVSVSLSKNDRILLSAAVTLGAGIATDEWPLARVVEALNAESVPDEPYDIPLHDSLDILMLLTKIGRLSVDEREETIRSWIRYDEKLAQGWKQKYTALFGSAVPSVS